MQRISQPSTVIKTVVQIHRAQQRKEFTSRSYYQSTYISKLPLEPLAKLILPFIGILGELWLSHGKWRFVPICNFSLFKDAAYVKFTLYLPCDQQIRVEPGGRL